MKHTSEFKLECIEKYINDININLPPDERLKERYFFIKFQTYYFFIYWQSIVFIYKNKTFYE